MGLVKCQDCEKEVSTRAAACPNCGAPITDTETTVLTETTSKDLKSELILCVLVFFLGLFAFFAGSYAFGFLLMVLSPILFTITKIKIWWHHE